MTSSRCARVLIATTTLALGGAPANIIWKELPPMPVGAAGGAAGLAGDTVVYAGGTTWVEGKKLWLRDVRRYDLTSGAWMRGPDLSEPLAYGPFVQSETGLEVLGGLNESGSSRGCRRLERDAKTWAPAGTLPQDGALGSAVVVGDDLYLLGGCPDAADLSHCSSSVHRRDKNGRWTHVSNMPDGAVALTASAVQAGRIYMFGGCLATSATAVRNLDTAWRYEPAAEKWQKLRSLPEAVRGASAAVIDEHRILLLGGYRASEFSNRVWIYDSENDRYEPSTPLPFAAAGIALVVRGQSIFGLGGEDRMRSRTPRFVEARFAPASSSTVNPTAEAIAEKGIALLQADKLPEAEAQFARALKTNPRLFEVHNLMGVVLDRQGKHKEARNSFLKAIELRKDFGPAHANLALNAVQVRDYRAAASEFRKALTLDPKQNNADGLRFDLALAQYRIGDYVQSLRTLGEISKAEARDAAYHALTGSDYRELDNLPKAIEHLSKATDSDPENGDYLYDLAIALIQSGANEQALNRLDAGIQRCPRCAKLYAARGVACYAAGKNEQSVTNYETAIRLEPGAADIHAALADLYAAAGGFDKAADEYETAVRLDASSSGYRVKQARNWLRLQQTDKAEEGFRQALTKDPQNSDAYLNLGKIASTRGDSAGAVRNLEKAVQLQPDNSAALYQLALAYRKAGQPEKASAAMERFRRIKDSER